MTTTRFGKLKPDEKFRVVSGMDVPSDYVFWKLGHGSDKAVAIGAVKPKSGQPKIQCLILGLYRRFNCDVEVVALGQMELTYGGIPGYLIDDKK